MFVRIVLIWMGYVRLRETGNKASSSNAIVNKVALRAIMAKTAAGSGTSKQTGVEGFPHFLV